MSRRNPNCGGGCDPCCPAPTVEYDEESCSVSWRVYTCCDSAFVDNQRYKLEALNDDLTVYKDYGYVSHEGRLAAIAGKRFRLTVSGPDCREDKKAAFDVPPDACPCPPGCWPSYEVGSITVSGNEDQDTGYYYPYVNGSRDYSHIYRFRNTCSRVNHTKSLLINSVFTPCPATDLFDEEYFICDLTSETFKHIDPAFGGPSATVTASFKVYGEISHPNGAWTGSTNRTASYRLKFVLQDFTEWAHYDLVSGTPVYMKLRSQGVDIALSYPTRTFYTSIHSPYPGGLGTAGKYYGPWCAMVKGWYSMSPFYVIYGTNPGFHVAPAQVNMQFAGLVL